MQLRTMPREDASIYLPPPPSSRALHVHSPIHAKINNDVSWYFTGLHKISTTSSPRNILLRPSGVQYILPDKFYPYAIVLQQQLSNTISQPGLQTSNFSYTTIDQGVEESFVPEHLMVHIYYVWHRSSNNNILSFGWSFLFIIGILYAEASA